MTFSVVSVIICILSSFERYKRHHSGGKKNCRYSRKKKFHAAILFGTETGENPDA
jgi:hypothetical protein